MRGEAQPQSRSGRQEEEEEEGWSRSALADCPGCPGLTPCTAVRTPVLPPSPPPPPQLILMLLSAVFYPATLSLSCSGALPVCLTATVAHQPLLIYFFFPPLFLRTSNWEASLLLSVTPRRSLTPSLLALWWHSLLSAAAAGCFFPISGKAQRTLHKSDSCCRPSVRTLCSKPPDVKFLIRSLLWSSRCCSTLALWPRLLKPGQQRTMRKKLLRLSFILPLFVIVSSLYVEHE